MSDTEKAAMEHVAESASEDTDWRALWEYEAVKFRAETLTSSFLSQRLLNAKGAAVLCDRCGVNYGRAVLVGHDQEREWLCGRCLGEPERRERFRV